MIFRTGPYQKEHDLVEQVREKRRQQHQQQKHVKLTPKF